MNKNELKQLKKKKIGNSCSQCTVCHEQYQKGEVIRILPCDHFFHYKCLKPWFKKSNACPLCRLNIKEKLQEQLRCSLMFGSKLNFEEEM
jgi:E3 ubiquitin-protein ligase RNF13